MANIIWSLDITIGRTDNSTESFMAIKDDDNGTRFVGGTIDDFNNLITTLTELNAFLTSIGYGAPVPADPDPTIADYTFRFSAITTNGSIEVLGSNKELADEGEVITGDLDSVVAELNTDSDFVDFLIATTETLVSVNTGISFGTIIGNNFIAAATGTPFADLLAGDKVRVTGSVNNNSDFTVTAVELAGARIIVSEATTTEAAGAAVTIVQI